jgi:hypothetical protein
LRRTNFFRAVFDAVEALVGKRNLPERMIGPLVEAAIGLPIRNSRYRVLAETSLNLASRDLKRLVDLKLLRPIGARRVRLYERGKALETVRDAIDMPDMLDEADARG